MIHGRPEMKTAYSLPIRFWALLLAGLLIYQFSTAASADWCKYEKDIEMTLDVSQSEVLAISAAAGDLKITGVSNSGIAVITGKACASKEKWLEASQVEVITGEEAQINVNLPDTDGGFSFIGNNYVWLDLKIELPEDLALNVRDSSGDIEIKNVASVQLQDSSGDIDIRQTSGAISIRDSSGDIYVEDAGGDFTIVSDSSGDIRAVGVNGSVLIKNDSSGDIHISQVSQNVTVERDSSGDISVRDVGGDFRVLKDGSGEISAQNVAGEVQLPEDA